MDINLNQLVDKGPTDLVVNKIKNLLDGDTLCATGI